MMLQLMKVGGIEITVSRIALRWHTESPCMYLYDIGNNQVLLNITGCNHEEFRNQLGKVYQKFDNYAFDVEICIIRKKRYGALLGSIDIPGLLNAIGDMVLIRMWYRTRGSCVRSLVMNFGGPHSPLYYQLKFVRSILLYVLIDDDDVIERRC